MNRTAPTDEWLMAEVANGKRRHLEPLVRRHASGLLAFIRRMVYDEHLVEDVLQEVFLAVWKSRYTYDVFRAFKPWLYAIAANACRRTGRHRPLRLVGYTSGGAPGDEDGGDLLDTRAAPGPSPIDSAVAVETGSAVQAAVAMLPEKQRAVLVLRIWNEMSYAHIARVLNRREASVRSNMHHALKKMRQYLQRNATEGERR